MSSQVEHTDVGAYALGLLEDDDRRAFEAHLGQCGTCANELQDITGTAHALAGIRDFTDAVEETETPSHGPAAPPAWPPATEPSGNVLDLVRARQKAARRARRGTYVIGAAAATVLVAAGAVAGATLTGSDTPADPGHSSHGPAQALVIWGERHSASNSANGASGVVGLESKGWGTHVGLELRGIRGPLKCRLEAVSKTGERSVVTGWAVPPKGYGVPGNPAPLITHGGTAIPRDRLDRFEVVLDGSGNRLLTIPL